MSMVAWGEISPERNCAFMVLRSGATSLWMFGRSVGEGIVRMPTDRVDGKRGVGKARLVGRGEWEWE
jgi:hypothetical protein